MAVTKVQTTQINDTYSTTEQNTGKLWVDGRPIYRKVLRGQITVGVGVNNVAHGISGLTNSMEMVSFSQFLKLGAAGLGGGGMQLIHRESAGNWAHFNAFDSTNVSLTSSFAWGNSYYGLVIEYVK